MLKIEDLNINILKMLIENPKVWSRVISIDLETKVIDQQYLSGKNEERILAIGIARRIDNNPINLDEMKENETEKLKNGIETKVLFLEDDTNEEAEINLLMDFCEELERIKPLAVIGYGVRNYDIPLLAVKKQYYGKNYKQYFLKNLFWKLVDLVESAILIDLHPLLKSLYGVRKLEDIVRTDKFNKLKPFFEETKMLFPQKGEEKAKEIYNAWRHEREKLKRYLEGDCIIPLIIAEYLALNSV